MELQTKTKPPEGYISLDAAARESNYNPFTLRQLARHDHIGFTQQNGKFFIHSEDLREYMHPKGYLTMEEAREDTGFSAGYLRNLAKRGEIRSIKQRNRFFLNERDVEGLVVPEGYVTAEEAASQSNFSSEYMKMLSRDEKSGIRRKKIHRKVYVLMEDVERYKNGPEGYLPIDEAVRRSGHSRYELKNQISEGNVRSVTQHRLLYLHEEDIGSLILPEGFITRNEASELTGYSSSGMGHLADRPEIRTLHRHASLYFHLEDLVSYLQRPEGFLTLKEASGETGYSRNGLGSMVKAGKIRSERRHGQVYVHPEDVEALKIPEGFITLDEAAGQAGYAKNSLRTAAKREGMDTIKRHHYAYIHVDDVEALKIPPGLISLGDTFEQTGYSRSYILSIARRKGVDATKTHGQVYLPDEYVRSLKVPRGFIPLGDAYEGTGYSRRNLGATLKKGGMRTLKRHGQVYVHPEDVEALKVPEGFISLVEVTALTGYSSSGLFHAVQREGIKTVIRHGHAYMDANDVNLLKIPEGFMSATDAATEIGYTSNGLISLARKEGMTTLSKRGQIYVRSEDVESLKLPEGVIPLAEAARQTRYTSDGLSSLAKREGMAIIRKFRRVYLPEEYVRSLKIPEGYISLVEAAEQSEYSKGQIKARIKKGTIGSKRQRGKIFVSARDLGMQINNEGNVELLEDIVANA